MNKVAKLAVLSVAVFVILACNIGFSINTLECLHPLQQNEYSIILLNQDGEPNNVRTEWSGTVTEGDGDTYTLDPGEYYMGVTNGDKVNTEFYVDWIYSINTACDTTKWVHIRIDTPKEIKVTYISE